MRVPGRADLDPDRGGDQQPLHLGHPGDEALLLPGIEWAQDVVRELVGPAVEQRALGLPGTGQPYRSDPGIGLVGRDHDEPVRLERAQDPAEVA